MTPLTMLAGAEHLRPSVVEQEFATVKADAITLFEIRIRLAGLPERPRVSPTTG
jgi:hypothetical protein